MRQWFIEISGESGPNRVQFNSGKLSLGRHADNNVVINDRLASRAHALIEREGEQLLLRDLHSSNGTFVNGSRISVTPVKAGDVARIGKTEIRFVAEEEPFAVDVIDESDVVDDPIVVNDSDPINFGRKSDSGDYERDLERLAQNLPDASFDEHEIALADARGVPVHAAEINARDHTQRRDVPEIFRLCLLVALRCRATDIHLEPKKEAYLLRLRVDGVLVDAATLPHSLGVKFAAVVKVLSGVDLAQRDKIQEGHFTSRVPSDRDPSGFRRIDFRVSYAPTVFGQKLVIRILDPTQAPPTIRDLGLPTPLAREIAKAIAVDAGMVLTCGPTGSGKTSTLYALIRSIDASQRNVVTIEDPVEIQLEGISQMQVDEEHEKGFAALLRSVLRQDPDVILVGEIRDSETARTAIQAAVTGHLVFSTVHTRDSIGAIYRLIDLGVEPHLLSQALHIVVAQRLVRKLCPKCKRPIKPTADQVKQLGEKHAAIPRVFEPGGCEQCLGTGYLGRRAIFELLQMTTELQYAIAAKATPTEIYSAVAGKGFTTLRDNGYELAAAGVTSMIEVERTVGR
jgi:general secretion pathway protein E